MEYSIVYSKRKTISLSIKDEAVIVKAPFGTPKRSIEKIVLSHAEWIEKNLEKQRQRNEKYKCLTDEDIKNLKLLAKKLLPMRVRYYADIMGLNYGRITVTSAKTRFGSCSSKGDLSFSYRLMLYPEEAIDYVVVHELAHLKEMNHSARFYSIIEGVLPDYKERRKILKK